MSNVAASFVSAEVADSTGHIVQKILVPCFFTVGLLGNSLSIVVLTRKRMRCSTNIYLAGLAIFDLLYLVMVLLLSFKKDDFIKTCKMYFALNGLFHWLVDGFSYVSIYIVVTFTVERYIAICHPIRGQAMCTEARAKKAIAIIAILVMLSVLSTAFEYKLDSEEVYLDRNTGKPCPAPITNNNNNTLENSDEADNITAFLNDLVHDQNFDILTRRYHAVDFGNAHAWSPSDTKTHESIKDIINATTTPIPKEEVESEICNNVVKETYYKTASSGLTEHPLYIIFFYGSTILYNVIPIILLITFNTYLILAVRESERLRKHMTNNINSRQAKQKVSAITQQNKITMTLIAVVILFIICQTPWAVYVIVLEAVEVEPPDRKFFAHICNILVVLNSATNFVLYCLMSDKYRKTCKELFFGYKYGRQNTLYDPNLSRQTTLSSSWYNKSMKTNPSFRTNQNNMQSFKKGSPDIRRPAPPTPPSGQRRPAAPPPPKPLSTEHRLSFVEEELPGRTTRNDSAASEVMAGGVVVGVSTPVQKDQILVPSESFRRQRSQSLEFKPKVRHSPDCKEFPNDLG